jgi:hypothetical protein
MRLHCLFFAGGYSLPSPRVRVVNSIVGRDDLISHGEAGVPLVAPQFLQPTAKPVGRLAASEPCAQLYLA